MRNVMKKVIAGVLAMMMLFAAPGCAKAADNSLGSGSGAAVVDQTAAGGWIVDESTEITDEQMSLFEKALEGLLGVGYEPVAYLGHQIVAGINHCFLCRATVVYPGAESSYKLVYIYEDTEGNAEVKDIVDLLSAEGEDLLGGWSIAADADLSEDVQAAFDKACESLLGVDYEAIALLASQVVAGVNYKVLAQATAVSPDAQPHYVVMTLYSALDGHVDVLSVDDVELGF